MLNFLLKLLKGIALQVAIIKFLLTEMMIAMVFYRYSHLKFLDYL